MRKILLATTAIVGFAFAGAAQAAAPAPVTVNVGGDIDVLAGLYHEAARTAPGPDRANHDFETLYGLNFDINGKGTGFEYGGKLTLDNNPDISNAFTGNGNSVQVDQAYIFLSGGFGKVQLGDSRGATDLSITAPTVGEGQVTGRYIDFLDTTTYAKNFVVGVDGTDHGTNVTYYTPKVGNDMHKVQAAVTYEPNFYSYGANVTTIKNSTFGNLTQGNGASSPYNDVFKGAIAYTGSFNPVTLGLSANVITGSSGVTTGFGSPTWIWDAPVGKVKDFTSWEIGAKAAAEGFTLGATYTDLGRYDTVVSQNKDQHTYTAGLKYEFNKASVGISYLGGEGYSNLLNSSASGYASTSQGVNYVKDFNSYGIGGSYAWTSGLTTNLDGVLFDQKTDAGVKNDGYVLLVSQKLAF